MKQRYLARLPFRISARLWLSRFPVPLAISLMALSLSAFNSYRIYFYERQEVSFRMAGLGDSVDFAVTNKGTRDAIVSGVELLTLDEREWKPPDERSYCNLSDLTMPPMGAPFVVKSGEIKLQQFALPLTPPKCSYTRGPGYRLFLYIRALNWEGVQYRILTEVGQVFYHEDQEGIASSQFNPSTPLPLLVTASPDKLSWGYPSKPLAK